MCENKKYPRIRYLLPLVLAALMAFSPEDNFSLAATLDMVEAVKEELADVLPAEDDSK